VLRVPASVNQICQSRFWGGCMQCYANEHRVDRTGEVSSRSWPSISCCFGQRCAFSQGIWSLINQSKYFTAAIAHLTKVYFCFAYLTIGLCHAQVHFISWSIDAVYLWISKWHARGCYSSIHEVHRTATWHHEPDESWTMYVGQTVVTDQSII